MLTLTVTPIYAAIIAALFLVLSFRVILYRRESRLSLGDEGDRSLLKRMRAQANCAEYAPIALILLVILEIQGAPYWIIHVLGLTLLAGRVIHGYGFSASPPVLRMRVFGMFLTTGMIAAAAVAALLYAVI